MQMPIITVVMTVYNSSKTLERAYNSVIEQDYQNLELIIVDDASTDNSLKLAEKLIESGTNNKKVVLISNKKNYGTFVCRNYAITQASGEYFCFHDSDDTAEKNYISSLFTCLTNAAHRKIVVCKTNSRIPGRKNDVICAASSMFHSSLLDKIGFFDSVRFAADTEFRMRCQAILGQKSVFVLNKKLMKTYASKTSLTGRKDIGIFSKPRKTYVSNFRKFHRTMSKKTKFEFPLAVRKFPVEKESLIGCDVDLSSFTVVKKATTSLLDEVKSKPTKLKKQGMKITANMATIPARVAVAEKAINSIIGQVDVVRLYLNNFKEVPFFIKNNPKIEYVIGGKDLNASGKHFWSTQPNEYYFTIDDDIIYPTSYVQDSLKVLNKYNDKVIVTCHGRVLDEKTTGYYSDQQVEVLHFKKDKDINRLCTVGGTGVSVRNTNNVKIDITKFKHGHMDDIEVSMQANKQGIPIIVRAAKGFKELHPPRNTRIWNIHRNKDQEQTKVFNSHQWRNLLPNTPVSNKKVSVLIAAYKAEKWIVSSVKSVLSQSLPEGWGLEVLVGIDGCQKTFQEISKLKDPRLGIINFHKNSGTYHTFNSMCPFATGSIFQRFDADDVMNEGWLHRVISTLVLNEKEVVIYGGCLDVSENLKSVVRYKNRNDGQAAWRSSFFLGSLGGYKNLICGSDSEALTRTEGLGFSVQLLNYCSFFRRVVPTALTNDPKTNHDSPVRKKIKQQIAKDRLDYKRKKRVPQKEYPVLKSGEKTGLLFFPIKEELDEKELDELTIAKETFRKFLNNCQNK